MAMKKKMKGNITSPALPGKSILAEVNNNEAGNIYNSLFAKNRKVEYDNKYIALVNIRTNPDNQIFRVMDDDEDIRILAEDITLLYSLNSAKKEWYMFCFPANGGFVH